jgi:hypothetical protein
MWRTTGLLTGCSCATALALWATQAPADLVTLCRDWTKVEHPVIQKEFLKKRFNEKITGDTGEMVDAEFGKIAWQLANEQLIEGYVLGLYDGLWEHSRHAEESDQEYNERHIKLATILTAMIENSGELDYATLFCKQHPDKTLHDALRNLEAIIRQQAGRDHD